MKRITHSQYNTCVKWSLHLVPSLPKTPRPRGVPLDISQLSSHIEKKFRRQDVVACNFPGLPTIPEIIMDKLAAKVSGSVLVIGTSPKCCQSIRSILIFSVHCRKAFMLKRDHAC